EVLAQTRVGELAQVRGRKRAIHVQLVRRVRGIVGRKSRRWTGAGPLAGRKDVEEEARIARHGRPDGTACRGRGNQDGERGSEEQRDSASHGSGELVPTS